MKYLALPALSLVIFTIALSSTQSARAALVLNIDLSTEDLFLTGSDTGSAFSNFFGAGAAWERSNLSNPVSSGNNAVGNIDLISSLDAGSTFTSFTFYDTVERDTDTGILYSTVQLSSNATSGALTTLNGNGTRISYAGYNATFKSSIQALASDSVDHFTLSSGSGFSSISIVVIPVPEPSSSLLLGCGMLTIIGARRRS